MIVWKSKSHGKVRRRQKMPHALTALQKEYLDFIRNYVAKNESSPRLDEIAEHFGMTRNSIGRYLTGVVMPLTVLPKSKR